MPKFVSALLGAAFLPFGGLSPMDVEISEASYRLGSLMLCGVDDALDSALHKARGVKYLRRVPTGTLSKTGKPTYRYYYRVTGGGGMGHRGELVEGAAFKFGEGHYHIKGVSGDTLKIVHDETGEEIDIPKRAFQEMLHAHHADEISEARSRTAKNVEAAQKHGTAKQRAAVEKDAKANELIMGEGGYATERPPPIAEAEVSPDGWGGIYAGGIAGAQDGDVITVTARDEPENLASAQPYSTRKVAASSEPMTIRVYRGADAEAFFDEAKVEREKARATRAMVERLKREREVERKRNTRAGLLERAKDAGLFAPELSTRRVVLPLRRGELYKEGHQFGAGAKPGTFGGPDLSGAKILSVGKPHTYSIDYHGSLGTPYGGAMPDAEDYEGDRVQIATVEIPNPGAAKENKAIHALRVAELRARVEAAEGAARAAEEEAAEAKRKAEAAKAAREEAARKAAQEQTRAISEAKAQADARIADARKARADQAKAEIQAQAAPRRAVVEKLIATPEGLAELGRLSGYPLTPSGRSVAIGGKTYPLGDQLRGIGARWDSKDRTWKISNAKIKEPGALEFFAGLLAGADLSAHGVGAPSPSSSEAPAPTAHPLTPKLEEALGAGRMKHGIAGSTYESAELAPGIRGRLTGSSVLLSGDTRKAAEHLKALGGRYSPQGGWTVPRSTLQTHPELWSLAIKALSGQPVDEVAAKVTAASERVEARDQAAPSPSKPSGVASAYARAITGGVSGKEEGHLAQVNALRPDQLRQLANGQAVKSKKLAKIEGVKVGEPAPPHIVKAAKARVDALKQEVDSTGGPLKHAIKAMGADLLREPMADTVGHVVKLARETIELLNNTTLEKMEQADAQGAFQVALVTAAQAASEATPRLEALATTLKDLWGRVKRGESSAALTAAIDSAMKRAEEAEAAGESINHNLSAAPYYAALMEATKGEGALSTPVTRGGKTFRADEDVDVWEAHIPTPGGLGEHMASTREPVWYRVAKGVPAISAAFLGGTPFRAGEKALPPKLEAQVERLEQRAREIRQARTGYRPQSLSVG